MIQFFSYCEHVYDTDLSDIFEKKKSESGSRFAKNYHGVVQDDGVIELVEDMPTDLYAEIQSHADSVDINLLVSKFMQTGDPSLLERRKGFFIDATELPKSYAEYLNIHNQAVDIFDRLPVEDRKKFDFDVNKFIASFGTDEFLSVFKDRMSADSSIGVEREFGVENKGVDVNE